MIIYIPKRVLFCIRLMSEAAKHRDELVKLDEDLAFRRKVMNQARYSALNDDSKSSWDTRTSDLEKQYQDKKRELDMTFEKLMATNFWPVFHPPDVRGSEENYQALKKVVTELRDVVTTINRDLHIIVEGKTPRAGSEAKAENAADQDRPNKRRRIGEDDEIQIFEGDQVFTIKEFNKARDSLVGLEGRLTELENSLIQQDADVRADIEDAVDAKWEDFGPPPTMEDGEVVEPSKIQALELNVTTTNEQLGEIANEVAQLMVRDREIDSQNTRWEEENAHIQGIFAQVSPLLDALNVIPHPDIYQ